MGYDERLDVRLGFQKDDAIRFYDELLKVNEFTFDPLTYCPKHIALDDASKLSFYRYVHCRMTMRTLLSIAGSGMRGDSIDSITVTPPIIRMNTKDIFERNCRNVDGAVPEDADYILSQLLALGNVHVMGSPAIQYGGREISARTNTYANHDDFIKAVKERIASGHLVFIYNYQRTTNNGPYCPDTLLFWRWNSIPKD